MTDAAPHDFTKPTRLSTDWQARLTGWHRAALTQANKSWLKQLPAPLEASLLSVDVAYAGPELARLPEHTMAYRLKIGERLTPLLVLPRSLVLNLVGLLLGDSTAAASDRELTLIEDKLADYFLVNHWLSHFREAWPGPQPLAWVLQEREANVTRSRLHGDNDVLIVASWRMHGAWGDADGAWLFPKKALIEALSGQGYLDPESLPEPQVVARRDAVVQRLPLSVQIVLGSAELPLAELSSLQVGDVVLLDQRAADGVLARIGSQELFRGQVGRVGSWKAIRIENTVKK